MQLHAMLFLFNQCSYTLCFFFLIKVLTKSLSSECFLLEIPQKITCKNSEISRLIREISQAGSRKLHVGISCRDPEGSFSPQHFSVLVSKYRICFMTFLLLTLTKSCNCRLIAQWAFEHLKITDVTNIFHADCKLVILIFSDH